MLISYLGQVKKSIATNDREKLLATKFGYGKLPEEVQSTVIDMYSIEHDCLQELKERKFKIHLLYTL